MIDAPICELRIDSNSDGGWEERVSPSRVPSRYERSYVCSWYVTFKVDSNIRADGPPKLPMLSSEPGPAIWAHASRLAIRHWSDQIQNSCF